VKKLFIDSDVILDLLAERPLFYEDAAKIFTWATKEHNLFGIITRNVNDYKVKDIVVQT
jgi:hypothetical protein